ncbi:hypothetical protein VAR608DRAFT_3417 [Variovorax sp. HW608]|nr:hypothetical protein VAR608DRAFT_3417 [Variovorax sp. HW608]
MSPVSSKEVASAIVLRSGGGFRRGRRFVNCRAFVHPNGKMLKNELRERFKRHPLPTA